MRNIIKIFISLFLLWATGSVWAGPAGDTLSEVKRFFEQKPAQEQAYWQGFLMTQQTIDRQIPQSPGLGRRLVDLVNGEQKAREINALGDYLYNMYISAAAQQYIPTQLDIYFMGVLNPLEMLPGKYSASKMVALYYKEKEAVRARMAWRFRKGLGITYSPDATDNSTEKAFLSVLQQSAPNGQRAGYMAVLPRKDVGQQQVSAALLQALSKENCPDKSLVCAYEMVDIMDMMDRRSGSAKRNYFYRSVSDECDPCSYAFCKRVCLAPQRQYDGWLLAGLSRIHAWPIKRGEVLQSAEGKGFSSPSGEKYPPWNYHAVALITLRKGTAWTLLVQDPFLFDEPVPLETWASRFYASATIFYAQPFVRSENIEKQFIQIPPEQMENLLLGKPVTVKGVTYKPAPVLAAEN